MLHPTGTGTCAFRMRIVQYLPPPSSKGEKQNWRKLLVGGRMGLKAEGCQVTTSFRCDLCMYVCPHPPLSIDGVDDAAEFNVTWEAMKVLKINEADRYEAD